MSVPPRSNRLAPDSNAWEQMLEPAPCNLCGADDAAFQFTIDRFTIVRCKRCGFLYINPRIRREKLKQLFSQIYSQDFFRPRRSGSLYHRMRGALSRRMAGLRFNRLVNTLQGFKREGRLLDIGCATGDFLRIAGRHSYEVFGVEVSEFASEVSRREVTPDIFTGTVKQASFKDESFDIITMLDVFSHLEDPTEDFLEIKRILKNDGILVFMTGNQDMLPTHLLKDFWGNPWEHSWLLGDSSLKVLLAKTDFEQVRVMPVGTISAKGLRHLGMPMNFIRMLRNITSYFLIRSEMIVICRKSSSQDSRKLS